MDAAGVRHNIAQVQCAFDILSLFQMTAYLYPPPATIKNESSFDFGIIGAGTAGSVIARRLAEDRKTKVLLVEAGGDPPFQADLPEFLLFLQNASKIDWKYTAKTSKTINNNCQKTHFDLTLGKMLGGSSSNNYMLYSEASCQDYDFWAAAVNDSTWNGDSVLPYLIKSQSLKNSQIQNSPDSKYFGYEGPIMLTRDKTSIALNLLEAFKELGYPVRTNLNIKRSIGYTSAMYNLGKGRRQHTAYSYLNPVREYPNLHVLKNTLATKIIFDKKKKAVAIQLVTKNKKVYVIHFNKEIIVSAGAINSPKLLMLSGLGPKTHLQNKNIELVSDVPVGKNFRDPTSVAIIHELSRAPIQMVPKNPHEFPAAVLTGLVSLNDSKNTADYETVSFFNYQKENLYYSTLTYGYCDVVTNSFFEMSRNQKCKGVGTGNAYLFTILTNLYPNSKGQVLLRSNNYNDPPLVQTEQNSDPRDIDNIVKYIKDFIRVENTTVFKKYGATRIDPLLPQCQKYEKESDDYWKCYISCLTNSRRSYVGTCAMGSVVDKYLYVKGVKNLRVVDASVIPDSLNVAPFASVIMLAEKSADMIKLAYGL